MGFLHINTDTLTLFSGFRGQLVRMSPEFLVSKSGGNQESASRYWYSETFFSPYFPSFSYR